MLGKLMSETYIGKRQIMVITYNPQSMVKGCGWEGVENIIGRSRLEALPLKNVIKNTCTPQKGDFRYLFVYNLNKTANLP